jgi:hypothetical protein
VVGRALIDHPVNEDAVMGIHGDHADAGALMLFAANAKFPDGVFERSEAPVPALGEEKGMR